MASNLSVLSIAQAMMRHAEARHGVIAENVANADTPDYKARDIGSFDAEMAKFAAQRSADPTMARTELDSMLRSRIAELRDVENNPNGNTVSLEDQIIRSAEAQGQHEMALGIYRKSMEMLRTAMGGQ